jgi:hypothetical protein
MGVDLFFVCVPYDLTTLGVASVYILKQNLEGDDERLVLYRAGDSFLSYDYLDAYGIDFSL